MSLQKGGWTILLFSVVLALLSLFCVAAPQFNGTVTHNGSDNFYFDGETIHFFANVSQINQTGNVTADCSLIDGSSFEVIGVNITPYYNKSNAIYNTYFHFNCTLNISSAYDGSSQNGFIILNENLSLINFTAINSSGSINTTNLSTSIVGYNLTFPSDSFNGSSTRFDQITNFSAVSLIFEHQDYATLNFTPTINLSNTTLAPTLANIANHIALSPFFTPPLIFANNTFLEQLFSISTTAAILSYYSQDSDYRLIYKNGSLCLNCNNYSFITNGDGSLNISFGIIGFSNYTLENDTAVPTYTTNYFNTSNATPGTRDTIYLYANWSDESLQSFNLTARLFRNNTLTDTQTIVGNFSTGAFSNFSVNLSENDVGTWNYTINATDINSNSNKTLVIIVDVSDLSPPRVLLNSPVDNYNTSTVNISFNFTATDAILRLCNISIDGSVNISNINATSAIAQINTTNEFNEGSHTWNVICDDANNNTNTTLSQTFSVDLQSPFYDTSYFASENVSATSFSAGDVVHFVSNWTEDLLNISQISLWINTSSTPVNYTTGIAPNQSINLSYIIPDNNLGNYRVWMSANDTAGNSNSTENITITVSDGSPPSIVHNSPVDGYNSSSASISFNFTATDNVDSSFSCNISIDGSVNISTINVSSGTPQINSTTSFTEGAHTWNVTCVDLSDNSNSSLTQSFTIDLTPPSTAPNLTTVNDSNLDGNIELSWQTDNNANEYGIFRSTTNFTDAVNATRLFNTTSTSFVDNTSLSGTEYWYAVTSIDYAGNENLSVLNTSTLSAINTTAQDTITPALPSGLSVVNSSGEATINWGAVTTDISGNPDVAGLRYTIWIRSSGTINSSRNLSQNGFSIISNSNVTTNTTTYDIPSSCGSSCTRIFVITTVDDAGNENLSTPLAEFTTNLINVSLARSSSSNDDDSGSGSGSGSGGGFARPNADDTFAKISRLWSSVQSGQKTTLSIAKDKIAVSEIAFVPNVDKLGVGLDVSSIAKPLTISTPQGSVYQYLDINPSNIATSDLSSVTITFSVPQQWITDNNLDQNTVKLLRYSRGWKTLSTTRISAENNIVTYRARSPGFSYFAITGQAAPSRSAPPAQQQSQTQNQQQNNQQQQNNNQANNQQGNQQQDQGSGLSLLLIIPLFLVIGLVGIFFLIQIVKLSKEKSTSPIKDMPVAQPKPQPIRRPVVQPRRIMPKPISAPPQLVSYITSELARGVSQQALMQVLQKTTWTPQQIQLAFAQLRTQPRQNQQSQTQQRRYPPRNR